MCVLLKVDLLMFFVHMHSITSSAQIQTRISRERAAAWSASDVTRYARGKKRDFALHKRERKLVHWVDQLKSERERAKQFFFLQSFNCCSSRKAEFFLHNRSMPQKSLNCISLAVEAL
jgi:hypothetical protein